MRYRLGLLVVIAAFLAVRVPTALRQGGATDEEWYAIPGLTIAREGVPRVPYSRATEPGSVFRHADRLLFAMPPLWFYAEAPAFLVGPATYPTARLATLAAACAAIALVGAIGRALLGGAAGLWAAGIYSLSRLLFFPAQVARPDMLCGTFGLAAVWAMARWGRGPARRPGWLAAAGAFLGLGGLTHPFALVFAVQVGLWALLAPGGWRARALRPAVVVAAAVLTFGLWVPLIARDPELFRIQFVGNILKPTGPGLLSRLLWPWPDAAEHLPLVVERAGPAQAGPLVLLALVAAGLARARRDRALGLVAALGWSAVYLLVALQGRHPLQGYWCYPAAFFALAAGWASARAVEGLRARAGGRWAVATVGAFWAVALLPGSGFRATWACVRHWDDPNYRPLAFARAILADLPPDARLSVGAAYSLEAYGLRGPRVLLGIRHPDYFDATRFPYDYALLGRTELEQGLDRAYRGRVVRAYGDPADPFSCYAVLLEPDPARPPPAP